MNTSTEENVPAVLKVKYKHIGLFKEHIQAKRKEVQSRVKYISKHGLLKGIPGSQSQPPLLWDRTVAVHNLLEYLYYIYIYIYIDKGKVRERNLIF